MDNFNLYFYVINVNIYRLWLNFNLYCYIINVNIYRLWFNFNLYFICYLFKYIKTMTFSLTYSNRSLYLILSISHSILTLGTRSWGRQSTSIGLQSTSIGLPSTSISLGFNVNKGWKDEYSGLIFTRKQQQKQSRETKKKKKVWKSKLNLWLHMKH